MFKYHSDMGHCFSQVVVVSKKSKFFFLLFLTGKKRHGIGKNVATFNWDWGRNSVPREGQKIPCLQL